MEYLGSEVDDGGLELTVVVVFSEHGVFRE